MTLSSLGQVSYRQALALSFSSGMRTRREGGSRPISRRGACGSSRGRGLCYANAAPALRLFRGDRTSVSADCRRLDHGKIATVRLEGLSRNLPSPRANMWSAAARHRRAARAWHLRLPSRSGPRVIRNWARRQPGSQAFVREALQTAAGTSILEIEERCVLGLLRNYDRSDGRYTHLNAKYLVEMPGVCCLDGGLRCPPSAESRADSLPRGCRPGARQHGAGDGFIKVLTCHVQTGTRGGSPAPMSDSRRSLTSPTSGLLTGPGSARSTRERLHAPRIQAYVKQLSVGSNAGPWLGCRCKRRRRIPRILTVV